MQIIPSILIQSEQEFIHQINGLKKSVEMIQLDIADGNFVTKTTWADPKVVKNEAEIDIELHLMVENPKIEIKKWTNVPQIKRILFHYESNDDIEETIELIKENDWEAGIVLNPDTPVSNIDPYLKKIEAVMFMGVVPGFQGQKLIPKILENINQFKKENPNIFVELDGGVNEQTLPKIIKSNVDAICPGSSVFGNERSPEENVGRMKKIIYKP